MYTSIFTNLYSVLIYMVLRDNNLAVLSVSQLSNFSRYVGW